MVNIKYDLLKGRILSHVCLDHPHTRERVNNHSGIKQPSGARVGSDSCKECEFFVRKDETEQVVVCSCPNKSEDNLNIHRYVN